MKRLRSPALVSPKVNGGKDQRETRDQCQRAGQAHEFEREESAHPLGPIGGNRTTQK